MPGWLLDEGRHAREARAGFAPAAIRQSSAAAPIGSAHSVLIQRRPIRMRGEDPLLRRHPVIETDAIVRIAELGAERLGRGRLGSRGHRAIAFCHAA